MTFQGSPALALRPFGVSALRPIAVRAGEGREGKNVDTVEPTGPKGRIEIQTGGFGGMSFDLASAETLIGRNPTTDITLLDEGISREHAVLHFEEDEAKHLLEDLQSTNGTKVNGKRVRSATLDDGDEIEIGHTCFLYRAL